MSGRGAVLALALVGLVMTAAGGSCVDIAWQQGIRCGAESCPAGFLCCAGYCRTTCDGPSDGAVSPGAGGDSSSGTAGSTMGGSGGIEGRGFGGAAGFDRRGPDGAAGYGWWFRSSPGPR